MGQRVAIVTGGGSGIGRAIVDTYVANGARVLAVDLKQPDGMALARRLVGKADGTIEGLRPGAMERLGLGPQDCLALNPKLVYGRVTGFGQEGPLAGACARGGEGRMAEAP